MKGETKPKTNKTADKILTEYIEGHICLPVCNEPFVRSDNTSVGRVSCIDSCFYSKCCSLGVGTVSSC